MTQDAGYVRQRLGALLGRHVATNGTPHAPQPAPAGATARPADDSGILDSVRAVERHRASEWTPGLLRRYLLCGERPPAIPSYTGLVEPAEVGKIGIACSGGGIRSAAFGLGALQVLQQRGVLRRARYLAGVSGGSYIAAAFCMVRRTWEGPARPEKPQEGWDDSDPSVVTTEHPPFFPGSPEEQYLRNRSSYLAPGAFGKIQFGWRLLIGMGLNLLFIAFAFALLAGWLALVYKALYPGLGVHVARGGLCVRRVHTAAGGSADIKELCRLLPLSIPAAVWMPIALSACFAIILGGTAIVAYRWRAFVTQVVEVWALRLFLTSALAGVLLVGIPLLLSLYRAWGTVIGPARHTAGSIPSALPVPGSQPTGGTSAVGASAVGVGGVVTLGSALLLHLRADVTEARQALADAGRVRQWYLKLAAPLRRALAYAIAGVVGPLLMLGVVIATMSAILNITDHAVRWAVLGGGLAAFLVIYYVADMNSWSLHSFYRGRLCSAFALKRVARADGQPPVAADESGIAQARNFRRLVPLSHTAIPGDGDGQQWPTLLVCAAANISDSAATPPGRRVTSFTFSPTAMGGPLVGTVRTAELEEACDEARKRYFTLPAAVAMSGAALSPSMGKATRGPLRFLMALANIRLGVWVPNPRRLTSFATPPPEPRREGEGELRHRSRELVRERRGRHYPTPRASYLLRELLGMNPLNANYLYVTDGGHYENLGIVELLRRGCTEIYCFDASNDHFDAIGDAVSLARSELDVHIDGLASADLEPDSSGISKTDCVTATITFPGPGAPKGTLYYVRLTMTGRAPADAVAYHRQDPSFPHDPTTDQLYTDQRFEAYRGLGACGAETALSLLGARAGAAVAATSTRGGAA